MARLSARLVFQQVSAEKVVLRDDETGAEIVLGPAEASGLEWFLWYFRDHGFGKDDPGSPCPECHTRARQHPDFRCAGCGQSFADRINGRWGTL